MYIGQYLHIKTIYTIQHDKLKFQIFISDQATRHDMNDSTYNNHNHNNNKQKKEDINKYKRGQKISALFL